MKYFIAISIITIFLAHDTDAQNYTYYQYDSLNRLTKTTLPNGNMIDYTYDELGNRMSKVVTGGGATYSITGQVLYAKPAPAVLAMNNMQLHLKNSNGDIVQSTYTNSNGNYQFSNVSNGIYTIVPGNNIPWSNIAVNAGDLYLIQSDILVLAPLAPFYKLAGDVNNDGQTNAGDLFFIQQRILSITSSFPAGNWLFENISVTVNNANLVKNLNTLMYGDANGSYEIPAGSPCQGIGSFLYGEQTYNTIEIGTQCWMKENLNIGAMINNSQSQSDNGSIEKYCYSNSSNYCNLYGGLYQWNEVMQYINTAGTQGICPTGWHIPTETEWDILVNFLGGETLAGGKLKEAGTTNWNPPNTGATNETEFTSRGSGYRNIDYGNFTGLKNWTYYWTSSSNSSYSLGYNSSSFSHGPGALSYGFSVRCIKND